MCLTTFGGCKDGGSKKGSDDDDDVAVEKEDKPAAKPAKQDEPKPEANTPAAAANPNALNQYGLPVTIPEPGSTVPTLDEWNAVTTEITVRGSSALNCETKMLREWLRVSCRKNAQHGEAAGVEAHGSGQQNFQFPAAGVPATGVTSVVVQVVRRKTFSAEFTWADSHVATLAVSWPNGAPDPTITLR